MRRRKVNFWFKFRWVSRSLLVFGVIWLCGFVIFAQSLPDTVAMPKIQTDAIVVLTGGSLRLETGLDLLTDNRASKLFVSGVHRGVDVAQLLQMVRRFPDAVTCCIALGYDADNTEGNAKETAAWLKKEQYHSIRLVTSSYHMLRSLAEFRAVMPAIKIIEHPVFPKSFKAKNWWFWPGSTGLIIEEYNKYLIAYVRRKLIPVLFWLR
tara:strand:- start:755 stop:1378 length:624 start_codon:yes stop_codon:yes gene_type:complete